MQGFGPLIRYRYDRPIRSLYFINESEVIPHV